MAAQINVHNSRRWIYVPRVPGSVKNPHSNNSVIMSLDLKAVTSPVNQ